MRAYSEERIRTANRLSAIGDRIQRRFGENAAWAFAFVVVIPLIVYWRVRDRISKIA